MMNGLRIELRHDLALTCLGGLALVTTAATIAWMILIAPVLAACLFVVVAGFFVQERHARLSRPVALTIGAVPRCAAEFAGTSPAKSCRISGAVLPNLALLTLRFADGSTSRIAVTPGRAGKDAFRRLCTWLRHDVSSPQGLTHEP